VGSRVRHASPAHTHQSIKQPNKMPLQLMRSRDLPTTRILVGSRVRHASPAHTSIHQATEQNAAAVDEQPGLAQIRILVGSRVRHASPAHTHQSIKQLNKMPLQLMSSRDLPTTRILVGSRVRHASPAHTHQSIKQTSCPLSTHEGLGGSMVRFYGRPGKSPVMVACFALTFGQNLHLTQE
jgi:hypothetical protein